MKDKNIITIIMLFIIMSVAGLGVYFSNGLTAYKENKIKYEEEKDKPEFNGLSKENISVYKFSDSEGAEYFMQLHNVSGSSNYYSIGNSLSEDIILSRKLESNTQLILINDEIFIFKNTYVTSGTTHRNLWDVTEITDEIDKSNIINDLLSNENNYYKINIADLLEEDTLLK